MAYALHDAARSGDLTALTSLIAQGANLNQKDKHQRAPIHLAAWAGQTDAVKALIAAGCQVGAGAMDDMNALHFAAHENSVDAARWLMNEGLSVNGKTRKGMTALHFAAQQGHAQMVELLLARKADPTSRNKRNETALDMCKVDAIMEVLQEAMAAKVAASSAGTSEAAGAAKKQRNVRKAHDGAAEPAEQIGPQLPPGVLLPAAEAGWAEEAAGPVAATADPSAANGGEGPPAEPACGGREVQEGGGAAVPPLEGAAQPGLDGEGGVGRGGALQASGVGVGAPPAKKQKVALSYLEQDESFEEED